MPRISHRVFAVLSGIVGLSHIIAGGVLCSKVPYARELLYRNVGGRDRVPGLLFVQTLEHPEWLILLGVLCLGLMAVCLYNRLKLEHAYAALVCILFASFVLLLNLMITYCNLVTPGLTITGT